jgi:hypothetical protein
MSTTTDITRTAGRVAAALGAWAALVVAITAVAEPTRDAVIFGDPRRALALLEGTDTRILDVGAHRTIVRGTAKGFVRELYANGAWLVLPARAGGCLGRQTPRT